MENNLNSAGNQAEELEESESNQRIQSGGILPIVLGVLLLLVIGVGTFEYFHKGQVVDQTNTLDQEIKALHEQIGQMKSNKVEVSKNATEALAKIQAEELTWSAVIEAINKLLPVDPTTGVRKINVISYSGSGAGKIALNMVTQPAGLPPYADVSGLIASFNNNIFFKDAYVPAISKGSNTDGSTTLNFVLNLTYQKVDTGANAIDNLGIIPTETSDSGVKVPAIKVPRT